MLDSSLNVVDRELNRVVQALARLQAAMDFGFSGEAARELSTLIAQWRAQRQELPAAVAEGVVEPLREDSLLFPRSRGVHSPSV